MLQLGIKGLGIARFKFNPISWFLKGEPGAWYDPSDLTTLFQDSAGTTPMSAVGTVADQPVGLMLDKSRGLALGAELVTNGDFSNGTTGWTLGAGVVISNGEFVATALSSNNVATTSGTFYANNTYLITLTVSQYTSGAMNFRVGVSVNAGTLTPTGIGKYSIYIRPTGDGTNFSIATSALTATIDNISVKQIAGNHAFQGDSTSTPAKRPMLSARVNLLTKTEDFSDGIWGTNNASLGGSAIAPDGTLTGKLIIANSTIGSHSFGELFTPSVAIYTTSAYFKAGGYNYAGLQIPFGGINAYAAFNLITGVVTLTGGGGTAAILSIGDGWYKCSLTATTISTSPSTAAFRVENDGTFGNWSGNGTSGIYIWHPDLRPTKSGALLPPYQRVNTASDYDTVGFPLYLKANGTSSAMSTNSIDFSSTDKMTVVTGVRKLSDATRGMIGELSSSLDTNNGSFNISGSFPNTTANYRYESKGTLVSSADCGTGYIAPINNVLTTQSYISTDSDSMRVNGTLVATSPADQGTGSFGNYPFYLFARAGTSLFLNGQFYGGIIRGEVSDTASIVQVENYMAVKTGIVIASMMGDSKIGVAGTQGFGVGIAPVLPSGFSEMDGTRLLGSANYGNYQYTDGSVMCWIPAFYYKIGTGSNGLALNAVDIKDYSYYADVATANVAGYALHRAFYNAGLVQTGVFVDKYQCSNNGGIASSIKMGNPLSSALEHNPFSGLTGLTTGDNICAGAFKAAKTRGLKFFCNSQFIFSALALLSLAHAQAATSTTACAWYDAAGITNFPKGNNNNALKDANDATVTYITDGYSNCGQTGSASNLAKTAHNGQSCGVVDLNGNLWEINTGIVSNGTNYYLLKTSVDINALTGGNTLSTDAWGAASIAANYDLLGATYGALTASSTAKTVGSATQVFDAATSGTAWSATSSGIPLLTGIGGTNIMGNDVLDDYRPNDMCAVASGAWGSGTAAGVWALSMYCYRTYSHTSVGFRSALYL